MQRILVFTPAEDHRLRAVGLAAALARKTGASLLLVRVIEESATWQSGPEASESERKLRDLLVDRETRDLQKVADSIRTASPEPIEIEIEVRWGVPWEVVIEIVKRRSFDLVVKPARGLSHSGRVFFGATALHLFRRCPCPVWVVGDDGNLPQRILLSIDPSADPTRREMASKLIEWGDAVRAASGAEIEIASVWQAPAANLLKEVFEGPELDAYVRDAFERAEKGLATIIRESRSGPAVARCHLLSGSPRDMIPDFAEDRGFDLVVVGTLGRTGVAAELLGETAEMILRGVRCSVLTVSPLHRSPRNDER
jgi:nucleotide-binding universal stress UspA family protein